MRTSAAGIARAFEGASRLADSLKGLGSTIAERAEALAAVKGLCDRDLGGLPGKADLIGGWADRDLSGLLGNTDLIGGWANRDLSGLLGNTDLIGGWADLPVKELGQYIAESSGGLSALKALGNLHFGDASDKASLIGGWANADLAAVAERADGWQKRLAGITAEPSPSQPAFLAPAHPLPAIGVLMEGVREDCDSSRASRALRLIALPRSWRNR
jgi:hypothetical protein